jgi:hypothetical protein
VIFETNTYCMRRRIGRVRAGDVVRVVFAFDCRLAVGEYTVTIGVGESGQDIGGFRRTLLYASHARRFSVARCTDDIVWRGIVNLVPELSIHRERGDA